MAQRGDEWLIGVRRGSVGVRRVTQRGDAWLSGVRNGLVVGRRGSEG